MDMHGIYWENGSISICEEFWLEITVFTVKIGEFLATSPFIEQWGEQRRPSVPCPVFVFQRYCGSLQMS